MAEGRNLGDLPPKQLVTAINISGQKTHTLIRNSPNKHKAIQPFIQMELRNRPDLGTAMAQVYGSDFPIRYLDKDSILHGIVKYDQFVDAITAIMGTDKLTEAKSISYINRSSGEHTQTVSDAQNHPFLFTRVLEKKASVKQIEAQVALARTAAEVMPELNPIIAGQLQQNLGYLLDRMSPDPMDDKLITIHHKPTRGINPINPQLVENPALHKLHYQARIDDIQTARTVLVRYAGIPQIRHSHALAEAYRATLSATQKMAKLFKLPEMPEFDIVAGKVDHITQQRPRTELRMTPMFWSDACQQLFMELRAATEEVTGNQNLPLPGALVPQLPATLIDTVTIVAKGAATVKEELSDLPSRHIHAIRGAIDAAVPLLAERSDDTEMVRLAQAIRPYPDGLHTTLTNALIKRKVTAQQINRVLAELKGPTG